MDKQSKEGKMNIIELSTYDSPEIIESKSEGYVTYGVDNSYFGYIQDSYDGSPTNRAIINTISLMIYGKGLDATDKESNPSKWKAVEKLFRKKDLRAIAVDLKKFGQFALQVAYNSTHTKIIGTKHQPIETIAKGTMTDSGEIENYFVSRDWKDLATYPEQEIPAFGTSKEKIEILYVSSYNSGLKYYSNVDYQAGLQFCTMEEEMSNYHINSIKNGFTPTVLVNFNDGVPEVEDQIKMENKIKEKWSGSSNAGKMVISFNKNGDVKPTIDTIDIPDAHKKYDFLSNEATSKLLISHRVTSPMLMGIKDNTGLGNNADELITATQLFNATVIRPFQDLIIEEGLDKILEFNKISFDLFFTTLQPIEFTEDGIDKTNDKEEVEKETGVETLSLSEDTFTELLGGFGESMDNLDGYEELEAVSAQNEPLEVDYEAIMNESINLSSIQNSEQDAPFYKVRYRYAKGTSKTAKGSSRHFCSSLLNLGRVYRKEDIIEMGNKGINKSFGHNGQAYNIFLYAGGVNCHHIWERVIFKKVTLDSGKPKGGNATQNTSKVSDKTAKKEGFKIPINPKDVTIAEIDKPNKGRI